MAARLKRHERLQRPLGMLALSLLMAACGSRSGLLSGLEGPAAGTGGTSGGTGGAMGGAPTGGTGGPTIGGSGGVGGFPSCKVLSQVPPILTVETEPSQKIDDGLRLTESSDDGTQVTGVFVRQFAQPTNILHHVTFYPWGSWQVETLGPVYSTTLQTDDYQVARSPGTRVAIAARLFELTLYPGIPVNASGVGLAPPIVLPNTYAAFVTPRVIGWEGPRFLVGTGDGTNLWASVVDQSLTGTTDVLGCAGTQPPQIGAVAFGGGWLVALSTGSPVGACGQPGAPAQPPTRIDVFRIGPDVSVSFLTSIDVGSPIIHLQAAPHPDGMYVVWSISGISAIGVIQGARISATSNTVVAGPLSLQASNDGSTSFEATALGDHLVVAQQNSDLSSTEKIRVLAFDQNLSLVGNAAVESDDAVTGPTSALGSRDGRSVLVAYTTPYKNPWRVHVARFDCAP